VSPCAQKIRSGVGYDATLVTQIAGHWAGIRARRQRYYSYGSSHRPSAGRRSRRVDDLGPGSDRALPGRWAL